VHETIETVVDAKLHIVFLLCLQSMRKDRFCDCTDGRNTRCKSRYNVSFLNTHTDHARTHETVVDAKYHFMIFCIRSLCGTDRFCACTHRRNTRCKSRYNVSFLNTHTDHARKHETVVDANLLFMRFCIRSPCGTDRFCDCTARRNTRCMAR